MNAERRHADVLSQPQRRSRRRDADRLFSYYVGIGGYNQDHRYVDQFDGAAYTNEFGQQLGSCPSAKARAARLPSCFTNGKPNVGLNGRPGWISGPIGFGTIEPVNVATRTAVVNVHIAIPHQQRRAARRHAAALRQRRNLHDVLQLGQRRGRWQLVARSARCRRTTWTASSTAGRSGRCFRTNYRSLVTPYLYPSSPPHPLSRRRFPTLTTSATAATTVRRSSSSNTSKNFSS